VERVRASVIVQDSGNNPVRANIQRSDRESTGFRLLFQFPDSSIPRFCYALATNQLIIGKDCVIHSTRHTFCTRLGLAGVDSFTLRQLAVSRTVAYPSGHVVAFPDSLSDAGLCATQ